MYEGPLDLLLDLIKQQKRVFTTSDFEDHGAILGLPAQAEELDVDVSSEFIYMAATLIYIKSKMLLPPDPLAGPEEAEDPPGGPGAALVEHEKFKNAAQLCTRNNRLKRMCGRSRTSRFITTKGPKAIWWFRLWIW